MATKRGMGDRGGPPGGAWPWLAAPLVLAFLLVVWVGCPPSPRLFLGSLLVFSGLATAVLALWEQARGEA
ncbi:MAG: hypothetical protein ACP5JV_11825, partial [Thermus sp.]|uniref:hypothetical protein n=1 Tax=Thermus sp. TaxID=275 RepID=UPI003D11E5FE